MRTLLLLPHLLFLLPSNQNPALSAEPPVVVLSFERSKGRQEIQQTAETTAPVAPATQNRNFDRQRRAQAPAGQRDPNQDTVETRSAELDRIVQESRTSKPPVDGFSYRVKIRNASTKVITAIIWEYQFKESLNPTNVSGRQFLCGVTIKPDKDQDFRVFSKRGPNNVVSIGSLANKSGEVFQETVLINFVEFADGSFWQRKDWNSEEARRAYDSRAVHERVSTTCLGL